MHPAADGFPHAFAGRVSPVEIPPCKIYFPSFSQLLPSQKEAYVYWRQELLAGVTLNVPLTYRFLYAYEVGARSTTLTELEERLRYLRDAYHADEHFASYITSWMVSARMARRDFRYDDVVDSAPDARLRVDLSLFNDQSPTDDALIALAYGHGRRERLEHALRIVRAAETTDTLLQASRRTRAEDRDYPIFSGYPITLRGVSSRTVRVPTYTAASKGAVIEALGKLIGAAEALLEGILIPADRDLQFVHRAGNAATIPIRRDGATLPSLPPVDSLVGLELSIDALWDLEMRLMMILVLWQAEIKPYVEGEIAFSRELRKKHELLSVALGVEEGIGPYRRGFFHLTRGARAPWRLDSDATVAADLHMGSATARFIVGLQRELRGSAARARILNRLLDRLAEQTHMPRSIIAIKLVQATSAERPPGVTA